MFPSFVWSVPHCGRELVPEKEFSIGIHAGALETALLLALLPDQVAMDKAVCEYPHAYPATGAISMEGERPGTASFAWMTHDLTRSGVLGDATLATEDMGVKLLDSLGQGWAQLIREIHLFKQPAAGAGPLGS